MQRDQEEIAVDITTKILRHLGLDGHGYHLKEVVWEFWPDVAEKARAYVERNTEPFYFAKIKTDSNGFWYVRTKTRAKRKIFGWRAKLHDGRVIRVAPCIVNGRVLVDASHRPLFFFERA